MSEEIKNENVGEAETAPAPKKKEKKNGKKEAEIEALKQQLNEKSDLLARTAAEFDNYKKRTEREKAAIAEYAKANVAKKLLPVLDNIDRAAMCDKQSADYIKGIEMIVKQFENLVSILEITSVAEVGDQFDPNMHEAVMHVEDETVGENVITEVLQKGYKLGDTVVRPAMVKVAN